MENKSLIGATRVELTELKVEKEEVREVVKKVKKIFVIEGGR